MRPDIVEQLWLCLLIGMHAVSLEHGWLVGNTLHEKRHQRGLVLFGGSRKQL